MKPNEVIVVDKSHVNDYGDLEVFDKAGVKHKIGKKRSQLFDLFQTGKAVELTYDNYQGKDYISSARLVQDAITPSVKGTPEKCTPTPKLGSRSYALSYAKDIACAHIAKGTPIKSTDIVVIAEIFRKYMDGEYTPLGEPKE